MSKLVFIRTDASKQIGSGHIMRCLSLAIVLRDSGVNVEFITRNHQGNLNEQIAKMNFKVNLLMDKSSISKKQNLSKGYGFLGVSQAVDASDTINVLLDKNPDWLIIDHYALDYRWEKKLRPYCKKIMVIDDMANRIHDCDLLLDQNYIHNNNRYNDLVSEDTIRLLGPKYALLREDFIDIENKKDSFDETKRIFLFYGGVDPDNLTTTTLKAISKFRTRKFEIDVVVGSSNSNIDIIKEEMKICPHTVKLYVQIDNIADLMIKADIAIGAGGSTTWERIAAGLPSIVVTLADNQIDFTRDLAQDGYLHWIGSANQVNEDVIHNALIGAIKDQINL